MIAFQACALSVTFRSEISSYVLSEIFEGTGLSKLRWKLFKTLRTLILASGMLKWQRRTTFIWQLQTHQNCLSFSWCGLVAWDNKLNPLRKFKKWDLDLDFFCSDTLDPVMSVPLLLLRWSLNSLALFGGELTHAPQPKKLMFLCWQSFWRARVHAIVHLHQEVKSWRYQLLLEKKVRSNLQNWVLSALFSEYCLSGQSWDEIFKVLMKNAPSED